MKKLLIAANLLLAFPAGAADLAVVSGPVVGEAAVENNNVKLAREQALADAQRKALEQGAGATIDTASVVEGGTLVQDRIFKHASGYIKSADIGTDGVSDGVYTISLSNIRVGTGDLSKDMDAIHAMLLAKGHPRLYSLIREESIEDLGVGGKGKEPAPLARVSQGVLQQRMESQLTKVGWAFVDPEVASGKVHVQNALSTDLAALDGKDFALTGADYVILGSVVVRPFNSGPDGQPGPVNGVLLRTVIKIKATDTGDTIASVELNKPVGGLSLNQAAGKAMELAGDEVTQALSKDVLERWRKDANGVGKLHLLVSVNDYEILQAFEDQVQKGVANVKAVDEMSFNDGKADLAVSIAGTSSKQLAGSLSSKTVKGMQVKVTKVTEHTVEVKLVR